MAKLEERVLAGAELLASSEEGDLAECEASRFRVQGLGCRVQGLGFRAQGFKG